MSSYTEARHESLPGGLYRIVSDDPLGMWFYVGSPQSNLGLRIPNGFISDGPSIPSWIRFFLKLLRLENWVSSCLMKASIVHDRMREDRQFSLLECDCYFLVAMQADQVNWSGPVWAQAVLRELAFLSVRTNRNRASRNSGMLS